MKPKHLVFFPIWGIILIALSSCYPNRAEFVDELDVAATDYDLDFPFATVLTYYMPDSIARITDDDNPKDPDLDPEDDAVILARIADNFEAIGYERLDEDFTQEEADVIILVSASTTQNVFLWWDYWGWWPGWGYYPPVYGPGWGWGYPWGGVSGYSYTTGTLLIQMVDPKASNDIDDIIPVVWLGLVNGLTQGSTASIIARANRGIDQVFAQSPYLDVN